MGHSKGWEVACHQREWTRQTTGARIPTEPKPLHSHAGLNQQQSCGRAWHYCQRCSQRLKNIPHYLAFISADSRRSSLFFVICPPSDSYLCFESRVLIYQSVFITLISYLYR